MGGKNTKGVKATKPKGKGLPGSQALPGNEPATIHYTELTEANPDEVLGQEWNTYRRELGRLLADGHEGKFILIKGETILGIFEREEAAVGEGYHKFLRQGFFVHQIREKEPILRVRGLNLPWPSSTIQLVKPA